jgi:uroporphyrinogen-III synthase
VEDTFEALLSVPIVSDGQVIGVVNAHYKQSHAHTPEDVALVSFVGEQMGGAIARANLRKENARLRKETREARKQLETRKRMERAKGILQMRYHLSEEEAYFHLRNESRRVRRPMGEVAEAIILSDATSDPAARTKKPDGIILQRPDHA